LGQLFQIPDFQRRFSWLANDEVRIFFNDVLNSITYEDGSFGAKAYFLGTIIIQGDIGSKKKGDEVLNLIDGQQRFAAITLFLRALYDSFVDLGEQKLADSVRSHFIDGQDRLVFFSETPSPFFQRLIKDGAAGSLNQPGSVEEDRIKEAYDFFRGRLKKRPVGKFAAKKFGASGIGYPTILSAIEKQLLSCVVVAIWSKEGESANEVFETTNAKGLALTPLDLAKNRLFQLCNSSKDPSSLAKSSWRKISESLNKDGKRLSLDNFFFQYWIIRSGQKAKKALYRKFAGSITTRLDAESLLSEMEGYAQCYYSVCFPAISDFGGKKQYYPAVEYIKTIHDFGLDMPRPLLVALFAKYKRNCISYKTLLIAIRFIASFHFVYTSACSLRTNRLNKIYTVASNGIYSANSESSCRTVLSTFFSSMKNNLPDESTFANSITKLSYSSSRDLTSNSACKFWVYELERLGSKGRAVDFANHTIEHVLGESSSDPDAMSIQYLIPLEGSLNSSIPSEATADQRVDAYRQSSYGFVKKLCETMGACHDMPSLKKELKTEFDKNVHGFYQSVLKF
jgi:hypothetical protein